MTKRGKNQKYCNLIFHISPMIDKKLGVCFYIHTYLAVVLLAVSQISSHEYIRHELHISGSVHQYWLIMSTLWSRWSLAKKSNISPKDSHYHHLFVLYVKFSFVFPIWNKWLRGNFGLLFWQKLEIIAFLVFEILWSSSNAS